MQSSNKNKKPLVNKTQKTIKALTVILSMILIVLVVGIIGFMYFFKMNFGDALYNTTITAATLGINSHPIKTSEKIFIGTFAMFSSIFFITVTSSIVTYIFNLYYRDEYVENDKDNKSQS